MRELHGWGQGRLSGPFLHLTVPGHHIASKLREASASTPGTSGRSFHERYPEYLLYGLQEKPGAPVAHLHGGGGAANRAPAIDLFEQTNFAGPEPLSGRKVDANREVIHGNRALAAAGIE